MVPTRLGPYEILGELGRGGMATVYRARQVSVERDVALKVIERHGMDDSAAVHRFQREARLIARLEHPHILPVYDFDGAHNPPYIVMRYLDGGTLREAYQRGALGLAELFKILPQISAALDYAHRQGIIHRDIKPGNIMIDRDGNAFVTDFGIARLVSEEPSSAHLTQDGLLVGTPEYMSPEQALGTTALDHRTDLYALGVLTFFLLTGDLPYTGKNAFSVLTQHIRAPIPSASARNPALPPSVDAVLMRALAKAPDARYPTALAFQRALAEALGTTALTLGRGASAGEGEHTAVVTSRTARSAPLSEHNKPVVALYVSAAAYGEWLEAETGGEAAHRTLEAFWAESEQLLRAQGGLLVTRTEHTRLALWGAETAHENDVEQAVRAGLALQALTRTRCAAWLAADDTLPINIGVHSGPVLLAPSSTPGGWSASGATLSLAERLMQSADGIVLVSHDVFRQTRGVFDFTPDAPLKVRGRADKVNTYQVTAARARAFRLITRGVEGVETQMVGRAAELARLQKAFLTAAEDNETQLITLLGEAGVGKSRLVQEFEQWGDLRPETYVLFRGRAAADAQARPYALARDLLLFRFEIHDDDPAPIAQLKLREGIADLSGRDDESADLIGYLCGFDLPAEALPAPLRNDPQALSARARRAFLRFCAGLARRELMVCFLEDLHQADDASLDLLHDLVLEDDHLHLLIIASTRPALFERRPNWGQGQSGHTVLTLAPLDKRDSRELVKEILKNIVEPPKELRDLLVERAEGNPYFMEELVKMLLDERVILKETENIWRVEPSRLGALARVPHTLLGLLEARLDTLLYPERLTLQRAAVIGRVFHDAALRALDDADDTPVPDLPEVLTALVQHGFIQRRSASTIAGSIEYSFTQSLLRDTIYAHLVERQRKVYHAATASWLASLERANEYLPVIAEHHAQAGALADAALYLQRAGEQASARGRFAEAVALYTRALAGLPHAAEHTRLTLLLSLGAAANALGDLPRAQPLLDEAHVLAQTLNDVHAHTEALYQLSLTETHKGNYAEALAYLEAAQPLARELGTPRTLAQVLYGLANTHFRAGHQAPAHAAANDCLALATELNDAVLQLYAHNRLGAIAAALEHDLDAANAHFQTALTIARAIGHRDGEQTALTNLGLAASLGERQMDVLRYTEEALAIARMDRNLYGICAAAGNLAGAHLELGDPEQAGPLLHEALRAAYQMDSEAWLVTEVHIAGAWKLYRGETAAGLQLLGLAQSHPAASADLLDSLDAVLRHARTRQAVSEAQIEAEMAAGHALDLASVVQALLAELPQGR